MDDKHLEKASKDFWDVFNRITNLMEKARGIEILLRIIVELSEHSRIQQEQDYKKYLSGNFKFEMNKYDRLINKFYPKNKGEFHAIRLIADNIAHANFHNAHKKVDEYINKYSISTTIDKSKKKGIFLLDHVEIEGEKYKIGYLVEPNSENLILEEFGAFEVQGYYDACQEIFDRANSILNPEKKDIGKLNFAVTIMRGLKRGIKEKSI